MLTINLVMRQVWVGGGVWHQGELHGQGGAGQGDGHAAVGGPHHPDDRVQLEAHVPILTIDQLLGVLQRSDGLEGNRSVKSLQCQAPGIQIHGSGIEPGWSLPINTYCLWQKLMYSYVCLIYGKQGLFLPECFTWQPNNKRLHWEHSSDRQVEPLTLRLV